MPAPDTRKKFIEYCKRRLGHPVITLELDQDQIEDRVDDALQKYADYHFDGSERFLLKHQITSQDITNKYIPNTDPLLLSVVRVFQPSQNTISMFDVRYQVRLNDFYNFNNVSMIHYYMTRNHLALLEFLFNVEPSIIFNRKDDKIFVNLDWNKDIQLGGFLLFDCYRALDPNTAVKIWNDMWLKEYATALIKRQWGDNLKKYGSIQMPGGVVLNGQTIYDEAFADIRKLEDELQSKYELPIDFMMG